MLGCKCCAAKCRTHRGGDSRSRQLSGLLFAATADYMSVLRHGYVVVPTLGLLRSSVANTLGAACLLLLLLLLRRCMHVRCATAPGLVLCGRRPCEHWSAQGHQMRHTQLWLSRHWQRGCR